MPRQVSTHWLRENAQERSPRRLLVIDTETLPGQGDDRDRHQLRLWSARLVRRRGIDPGRPRAEDYRGRTAGELADLVTRLARSDAALWIVAHNLNYDLAVTALPVELTERGWRITDGALTTDSPWCRMALRSRRLTIIDSWSWLPAGLEHIGQLVNLPKLELPDWEDEDADWWARCDRDVAITAKAMLALMDWWDEGRYGNWSVTGPATGWSSYRHRKPRPRVLVQPDPEARALEARAVTGGRRQVLQVGDLPPGVYADLDVATAHLTVMSERVLPYRRLRHFDRLDTEDPRLRSRLIDVLAECEVETLEPRYPWDSGKGVFYPVGRFRTVLAGPELREAHARGELRSIGAGWTYGMGDHMTSWARWLAHLLDTGSPDVPKVVRLMAKHWSRCVPGKWAGHTSEVLSRVPDPRPGWGVERGFVADGRRRADFLRVGGEVWTIARDEWADDAFPAILAWIQSYTRVTLGRLIDHLGPAALTMNTDGTLVDVTAALVASGHDPARVRWGPTRQLQLLDLLLDTWAPELAPFTVRIKEAWSAVSVISPQHLILDGERRLAGIPRKAVRLDRGRFRFEQWPKLRVQLAQPAPIGYRVLTAERNLSTIAPTGWLYRDGRVAPVALWPDRDGATQLQPPTIGQRLGDSLAPIEQQHQVLQRFLRRSASWAPEPEPTRRPLRRLSAMGGS